jgi:hypothetical protein
LAAALLVGGTLFFAYAAAAVADVYAVSGVVMGMGQAPLLLIWSFDALLTIAFAGMAGAAVGRISPTRLLPASLLWTGAVYAALAAGFFVGLPRQPLLLGLAAVDKLQMNVVYFAAWAVARDLLDVEQTVTYYGRINAMTLLGSLAGSAAAGLAVRGGVPPGWTLALLAVLFLGGSVLLGHALTPFRAAHAVGPAAPHAGLRASLAHLRASPALRRLATLGLLNGVGYTVLAWEVIRRLAAHGAGGAGALGRFALVFAALRIAEPLAYSLVEVTLAAPLIRRVPLVRLFLATPAVVGAAMLLVARWPSPLVALGAACALQAAFGLETPARAALIAGLPPSLRAGVGVISDGTFYQLGYLTGSAGLGLILLAGASRGTELALGGLAAALAIALLARAGRILTLR